MRKGFLSDRSGNFGVVAAVLTIPLMLSVGLAVDYSMWSTQHTKLQQIADSAALAVASSREDNPTKMRAVADAYIAANTSGSGMDQITVSTFNATDEEVEIDLTATMKPAFMSLANITTMDLSVSAKAVRGIFGSVEVALVLDNTESMNYENKIGTLKIAAAGLVTELHKNEDADVRIALVPYAEQLNVGLGLRNESWLSVPDDYTKTVTTTKEGYWYQPMKNTKTCRTWQEAGSRQVEKDGVWVTESWPRRCTAYEQVPNGPKKWVPPKTTTTVTAYKWFGCIGARVKSGHLVLDDGQPSVKYPGFVNTSQKCVTEIVPLTDSEDTIQSAVSGMVTSRPGYVPQTYIPGGMMWGINVLSKSEPYSQALDYDTSNVKPRKVIVLMTDGLNTRRTNLTGTLNLNFLLGGPLLGDTNSANAAQRDQTNADTLALCDYAKSKGIEIFSVAFKVDDQDAKDMLETCATDATHYYDASDSELLLAAFAGIGESLTRVRLTH